MIVLSLNTMFMKKLFSILIALTMVVGAVRANDADPKSPKGMAVIKSGSIFKLFYKGEQSGDVKVKITDSRGDAVFTETIKNIESFVRPYNFSSLSEGEYTIELDGRDGKQAQHVSYVSHNNIIAPKLANILHVTGSNQSYMLTVSNKAGADVLKIKIYDAANSLVYSETQEIAGDFAKVYNLNKVGKNFSFEVTDSSGSTQLLTYNR
jgi:hypothetical protein